MALPLVAVVGQPNVGKSTLFNRLIGQRRSIVGDEPGITRDRIYGEVEWTGERFAIVDTGGIVPDDEAIIPANIFKQAGFAIDDAQAVIWVVDARQGLTPLDEELAKLLRATGKRVLVAANKTEAARVEAEAAEFYRFGFEEVFPVSAEQGIGLGEMLDALVRDLKELPKATTSERSDRSAQRELRLAIVGRPNVGKSSLLNRLIGEERVIVSPVAGTTRDAIDTVLETAAQKFRLIDTAGIRRKGKTGEMAEKLSVVMAMKSLARADVAIVVVDAEEGVTALDAHIAGYAHDAGCSIIIAVNKWDALEDKKTGTVSEFERSVRDRMKFLDWAPVVTISALKGQRVEKLLPLAVSANAARNRRIPTSQLNAFFERAVSQPRGGSAPAPVKGGVSRLHVQYMTQVAVRPPTFVLFTSGGKAGLHFSYERYLQNQLRKEFDFFATPLRLVQKHKKRRKR
ncbi:MAG TPA: ribosome biogenesis GTPase Der [Blastocatellia bacterium]|nr:ribosome biogenesis GTPase Der [Blastocatellia bacterium]HAF21948.1 ribosome biogenesis GTPase Der [Blastocatellia bacterium]